MKKSKFTLEQKKELLQNPNILKVCNSLVYYTEEFKAYSVEQRRSGIATKTIFANRGIPSFLADEPGYAKTCIKRWRKAMGKNSKSQMFCHGNNIIKQKSPSNMSRKELISKISYLEVENNFLKKLKALETL